LNIGASHRLQGSKVSVPFGSVYEVGMLDVEVDLISTDCVKMTLRSMYMTGTLKTGSHPN
jgi:hypothetical protein